MTPLNILQPELSQFNKFLPDFKENIMRASESGTSAFLYGTGLPPSPFRLR